MSSRSAILDQIRRQLGRGPLPPDAVAALEARRPAHTRVAVGDDLVTRFIKAIDVAANDLTCGAIALFVTDDAVGRIGKPNRPVLAHRDIVGGVKTQPIDFIHQ